MVGDGARIHGFLVTLHSGASWFEVALDTFLLHFSVRQSGRFSDDLLRKRSPLHCKVLEFGQLGQSPTTMLCLSDPPIGLSKVQKLPLILCRSFHACLLRSVALLTCEAQPTSSRYGAEHMRDDLP